MAVFESTLALLLGAVILTGLARRVGVPYPSLLAISGAALAFVPAGPELVIEPDLALALFVAPVLSDAAFDTSPHDLRRNIIPLVSLVVVAVGLTTAAVASIGCWLGERRRADESAPFACSTHAMKGADFVSGRIAEIGEIHLAQAAFTHSRRLFAGRPTVCHARRMPRIHGPRRLKATPWPSPAATASSSRRFRLSGNAAQGPNGYDPSTTGTTPAWRT